MRQNIIQFSELLLQNDSIRIEVNIFIYTTQNTEHIYLLHLQYNVTTVLSEKKLFILQQILHSTTTYNYM